jgi:hypothetical protein
MSWKSGLSTAALVTLVAMGAMTSANAFSSRSPEARYIASRICDETVMWQRCGDHFEYVTATVRSPPPRHPDTSPQYMKDIDPRYNQGMLNAGGDGGGGGAGGGGGR